MEAVTAAFLNEQAAAQIQKSEAHRLAGEQNLRSKWSIILKAGWTFGACVSAAIDSSGRNDLELLTRIAANGKPLCCASRWKS